MRVLGILGSPHVQGNTSILLDAVLEGARQAGAEIEKAGVAGINARFCVACSQCYRTGRCQYQDDIEMLKEKMLAADGIVLGSPVYIRSVSAQLKTLMDRSAFFIHCFLLEGKYGAAVATAGGSMENEVAQFQADFLRSCGAQIVGTVGARAAGHHGLQSEAEAVARATALGRTLAEAIAEKRRYPGQEVEASELFPLMKNLVSGMGEQFPAQYNHWKQRGWL